MSSLLPYFLSYLGGLLAAFPKAAHFLSSYLLPVLVAGFGWMMFFRKKKRFLINWLFLAVLLPGGYFSPALSELSQPPSYILNHIDESRRSILVGEIGRNS